MPELSDELRRELQAAGGEPLRLTDPVTQQEYVLVSRESYERLKGLAYDGSEWTAEERDELAWEAGRHAGWDDMSEYDNYPEKRP